MAKREIVAGSTDQTIDVFIQDSSSSTGAGLTGLVFNTASLTCYYRKGATGTPTALSLVTQTVGAAHSDGGFVAVDGTNCPGQYRLDLSDTIVAAAGMVTLYLKGATNMAPCVVEIEVVAVNKFDAVRGGMTALPNANAEAAGGLYTRGSGAGQINQSNNGQIDVDTRRLSGTAQTARDIGASVLLSPGTGTGQISLASGAVTVGTNNDKTAYSLSQAFPTNFAALAITAGGAVTVGTNNDKTGYSLSQSFPANFAALGINASGHLSRVTLVDTLTTYSGNTPQTGDSYARLGAPSLASVSADIGAVSSTLGTVATSAAAAASSAATAESIVGSGTFGNSAIKTAVDAVKAKTDNLPSDPADQSLIIAATDTLAAAIDSTLSAATSAASSAGSAATIVGSGTHGNAALKTLIDAKPTAAQLLATAVATSNTAGTVGDCLNAARAQGFGKWVLNSSTKELKLYGPDGTTVVATFDIGPDLTAPLTRTPQ